MVSRGKRRASQRVRTNRRETSANGGPQAEQISLPGPPQVKKNRLSNLSSANAEQDGHSGTTTLAAQNVTTRRTSDTRRDSGVGITSPVRTRPSSRRSLQSKDVNGVVSAAPSSVTQDAGDVRPSNIRTADTIPEELGSDDRDVHVVRRKPLESSAMYSRYVSQQFDEDSRDEDVVRRVFSLMFAVNGGSLSTGGGRRGGERDRDLETTVDDCIRGVSHIPVSGVLVFVGEQTSGLSITREILSSFQREFDQKLVSEMKKLQTLVSDKFQGLKTLESGLREILNEYRVVTSSGRGASSSQGRPTPLALYETKLDLSTPHCDGVFNTGSICMILRVNVCKFVVGLASERGQTIDNISLALLSMLFGLLPSQKRAALSNGVGRRHSSFRFTIVLNVLFNVPQKVFKRFIPLDLSDDGDNTGVVNVGGADADGARVLDSDSSVMPIKQPKWLRAGFIGKVNVEEARARIECINGTLDDSAVEYVATGKQRKPWLTVKENPDRRDIARYGALKAYRCITTGLYQAREKARWVLFEELVYIMTIWEDDAADVDQHTLKLKWDVHDDSFYDTGLSAVPDCVTRKVGGAKADDENNYALAEFLSSHREMVLCVSHEVGVRVAGGSPRQRRALEVRLLHRAVNFIDVALRFCIVFTEQSVGEFSNLSFLGGHPDSLKCAYADGHPSGYSYNPSLPPIAVQYLHWAQCEVPTIPASHFYEEDDGTMHYMSF